MKFYNRERELEELKQVKETDLCSKYTEIVSRVFICLKKKHLWQK